MRSQPKPSTTPSEPLVISPPAQALMRELAPRSPAEQILVLQVAWAAAQITNLLERPPAQPDASWLRLFSLADRVFHRNLRELRRNPARRPETSSPAPSTASPHSSTSATVSNAPSPPSSSPPPRPSFDPQPRPSPSRTPDRTVQPPRQPIPASFDPSLVPDPLDQAFLPISVSSRPAPG